MGQAREVRAISNAAGRWARGRVVMRSFIADEGGATAIEYGLIVALIAVAIIGSLAAMGGTSGNSWASSWAKISAAI